MALIRQVFVTNLLYKEIEQFGKDDMKQAQDFLMKPTDEKFKFVLYALDDVVGEEKTKVSLFVLQAAGESVHIAGDSSSGKSFLGDAVLDLIVADILFEDSRLTESEMTEIRKAYCKQIPSNTNKKFNQNEINFRIIFF